MQVYGVIHPYLQTGSSSDLAATMSMGAMALSWATSMAAACQQLRWTVFDLLGVSAGSMFGHQIALAATQLREATVRRFILVDPVPAARPWQYPPRAGLRQASQVIAQMIAGARPGENPVPIADMLCYVAEDELGVVLAEFRASLGLSPFNESTVKERYRELHAVSHLLEVWSKFLVDPSGQDDLLKEPTFLVLAQGREEFFTRTFQLPSAQASEEAARQNCLNITHELVMQGSHLDVVSRCLSAKETSFTETLHAFMGSTSDDNPA